MQYGYCKMRLTQPVMSSDQAALSLEKFYIYCFKAIGKGSLISIVVIHSFIYSANICQISGVR